MTVLPNSAAMRTALGTLIILGACQSSTVLASISGPPPSYIEQTSDGKHILVMLSTVPLVEDKGNACTLPNGNEVLLRQQFSASGLYDRDSLSPSWQVDWYEESRNIVLSPDGRYAVRVNRFGDGAYGRGGALSWGLKFYDQGVEINSHDVADLVDYPSLMEFVSRDWHLLWFADYPEILQGEFFDLQTSTRDTFRFKIATGEIVAQRRFWRHFARAGIGFGAVLGVCGLVWTYRRLRAGKTQPVSERPVPCERQAGRSVTARMSGPRWILLAAIAVFNLYLMPYATVFALSILAAVLITGWSRRQRLAHNTGLWPTVVRTAVVSCAWFVCYMLSFGPAIAMIIYLRLPDDVRQVVIYVLYTPLFCVLRVLPGQLAAPFRSYYQAWW